MRMCEVYQPVFVIHVLLVNGFELKDALKSGEDATLSVLKNTEVSLTKTLLRKVTNPEEPHKKSKIALNNVPFVSKDAYLQSLVTHTYLNSNGRDDVKRMAFIGDKKHSLPKPETLNKGTKSKESEPSVNLTIADFNISSELEYSVKAKHGNVHTIPGNIVLSTHSTVSATKTHILNIPFSKVAGHIGRAHIHGRSDIADTKSKEFNNGALIQRKHHSSLRANGTCELTVSKASSKNITHMVLKNKYNFIYMHLNFNNLTVHENDQAIYAKNWVWTFDGKHGGRHLLYLPQDFGYLSFGILWSESSPTLYVRLEYKNGDCDNLTIGEEETDKVIAYALGNMTKWVAKTEDNYNSSYWCYNKRIYLSPRFIFYLCENSICTIQTFGYTCCRFRFDYITKERKVECSNKMYNFGIVWWALPVIIGDLLFAFYPLVLANIGSKLFKPAQPKMKHRLGSVIEHNETDEQQIETNIYLSHCHPVSFVSVLFSPFVKRCKFNGPVSSRLLRTLILLLPMILSTIRVCIDYHYSKQLIEEAVTKGGLVGFSSLIAGPSKSRKHFLYVFGGPYVALPLFLAFGSIFILVPSSLHNVLVRGLINGSRQQMFVFLTPMHLKERYSRVPIRKYSGYNKIYHYLLANLFMILNVQFWCHSLNLMICRWNSLFWCKVDSILTRALLCIIIFPFYVIFSIVELIIALLLYAFPVLSGFFIFLKAYLVFTIGHQVFSGRSACTKMFRVCYLIVLFLAVAITWYMYSIIFFDGFWFISKVVMFTYSGVFAYPKISYGYIILILMAIYYLLDSIHMFGVAYRDLLKLSIDIWERERECSDSEEPRGHKRGIPVCLFEIIIERCKPKRVQVFLTIFKAASIVLVLCVSIYLLIAFNRFQDVSLISHVFTVLFICALPQILNKMCFNNHRRNSRKKLRKQIYNVICTYKMYGDIELGETNERLTFSRSEYEDIDVDDD